jgi:hypothetical protein
MTPFFLNPWAMVLGGMLIAAPIIIHLINRMRFKRLRWAAMEFLLKSQKKMRRKLIVEQLILLLLRILLVLLAGFLMARFLMARSSSDEGTTHFVLIDDTFSMQDSFEPGKSDGANVFSKAKDEVKELAKTLNKAATPQRLCVALLSDPETPIFNPDHDLKTSDLTDLTDKLDVVRPTALHVDPEVGVRQGRLYLQKVLRGSKVFHLYGDFREQDWVSGAGADNLAKEVDKLIDASVNVNFFDTVQQFRSETRGEASGGHENLAIVDLRAEKRVVAENEPTDFVVAIENYGNLTRPSFLTVKVNGVESFQGTQPIASLPAMQRSYIKFNLLFAKTRPSEPIVEGKDGPEERDRKRRGDSEFQTVSVEIEDKEGYLQGDNLRDLVIEVRRKIPLLIIDGNDPASYKETDSDFNHLKVALQKAAKAYEVERREVKEIVSTDLSLYPTVYLCNVAQITDEAALKKLQDYARGGGSLVFCMGDKTIAGFYNNKLHTEMHGLFPVKIASSPTPAMTEEQRDKAHTEDLQYKVLFPPTERQREFSPQLNDANFRQLLRFLLIERYYPTLDRSQWAPGTDKAEVLAYLSNRKTMDAFARKGQDLMADAERLAAEVASDFRDQAAKESNDRRKKDLNEEAAHFEKYTEVLTKVYKPALRQALEQTYPYKLVIVLEAMLHDPGLKDDPLRPNMPDLWAHKKMRQTARDFEQLRKSAEFGDPLVVANSYGSGKVVAFLTTAGTQTKWNDWGGGSFGSATYPVFIMDLQRYLVREGEGLNRKVGTEPVVLEFDSQLYDPNVTLRIKPQKPKPPPKKDGDGAAPAPDAPRQEEKVNLTMKSVKDRENVIALRYESFKVPGVYTFEVKPLPGAGDKAVAQSRAYAFNIDAENESDLKRASTAKLLRDKAEAKSGKGKIAVKSPGDKEEIVKEKKPDASEMPWIFLLILAALIAEQAMAVHLSFHLKGDAAGLAPPPARASAA